MPGTPALWSIPDAPEYGTVGTRLERTFWVVDEVSTVLGLATEGVSGTAAFLIGEFAFLLGAFSVAVGGMIGEFWAIGAGYAEAKTIVVKDCMTRGFAIGCVVGAHGRNARSLIRMFGYTFIATDPDFRADANKAYVAGLIAGFMDASGLRPQQKKVLWTDIESRAAKRWSQTEVADEYAAGRFYAELAGYFRRYHLQVG